MKFLLRIEGVIICCLVRAVAHLKVEELGEKPVPVSLCALQMSLEVTVIEPGSLQ
jgi:hypothetical protein